MLKIIETFSGIGSQAQALKNIGIEHSIEATVDWEIGAMYAYDIMHNGPQDLSDLRHHTRTSLIEELSKYNLSGDGKKPLTNRALNGFNVTQLKAILCAIERNNNLVDITTVTADKLPDADVLSYTFPCQDLSVSGHWHHNSGGIDRDANNRSTLLWQIERILKEYVEDGKSLPKFLVMENVNNILSSKHIDNFNEWRGFLEKQGYINQVYTLDARDFGIPQSRIRTYMISVLASDLEEATSIRDYFFFNNLERIQPDENSVLPIGNFLRLDYTNKVYRKEALNSTPMFTPSREKIYKRNVILATDHEPDNKKYARTITTKQDRNPNSGIIEYKNEILTENNKKYRNLTPRECFLLMGFEEEQYNLLMENNIEISSERKMLQPSKLIQLAGNSIVVQVLEKIFEQIDEINRTILVDTLEEKKRILKVH